MRSRSESLEYRPRSRIVEGSCYSYLVMSIDGGLCLRIRQAVMVFPGRPRLQPLSGFS